MISTRVPARSERMLTLSPFQLAGVRETQQAKVIDIDQLKVGRRFEEKAILERSMRLA